MHVVVSGVTSTQDYLQDAPELSSITALYQTTGRGQWGRKWQSQLGNLMTSMRVPLPAQHLSKGGIILSLVVRNWIDRFYDGDFTLKWPNDIFIKGKKVAGILVESDTQHNHSAIMGVGVNLCAAPPLETATTLGLPINVPPQHICALYDMIGTACETVTDGGFDAIRQQWLSHAHPIGTRLYTGQDKQTPVMFQGIDDNGQLVCSDV